MVILVFPDAQCTGDAHANRTWPKRSRLTTTPSAFAIRFQPIRVHVCVSRTFFSKAVHSPAILSTTILNDYLIIVFLFSLRQRSAHSWSFSWFQNSRRANLRLHRSPRCVAFGYTAAKHSKQTILLLWERRLTLFKTLDCYFVNCSNTSILARAQVQRFVSLDTLATQCSRCLLISSLRLPTHLAAQSCMSSFANRSFCCLKPCLEGGG
jgi:hypothetical protein